MKAVVKTAAFFVCKSKIMLTNDVKIKKVTEIWYFFRTFAPNKSIKILKDKNEGKESIIHNPGDCPLCRGK